MKTYPGYYLHQLGPYIGKIRPSLARKLVLKYSESGDLIWDPFCGSGTIALECKLLGRNTIATDTNPYACSLTRAKLNSPNSFEEGLRQLETTLKQKKNSKKKLGKSPEWVRKFFHPKTLSETRALMNLFVARKQFFLIGCLLHILHHQRPGFLSYPSSHLVPYLRDKLFPYKKYPELYQYRDPIPRLKSKIIRVLRDPPKSTKIKYHVRKQSVLNSSIGTHKVNTIITSPPYMDNLDYVRDNRLRLWFLGANDLNDIKRNELGGVSSFESDFLKTLKVFSRVLKTGGYCILVVGDIKKNNKNYNLPQMITKLVKENVDDFIIKETWKDRIPADRRAIRNHRGTRVETIIVMQRKKGG